LVSEEHTVYIFEVEDRLGYIGRLEERLRFEPGTSQIEAGMLTT
jgi:hypothetical protein